MNEKTGHGVGFDQFFFGSGDADFGRASDAPAGFGLPGADFFCPGSLFFVRVFTFIPVRTFWSPSTTTLSPASIPLLMIQSVPTVSPTSTARTSTTVARQPEVDPRPS